MSVAVVGVGLPGEVQAAPGGGRTGQDDVRVTLLTGDRVTVRGGALAGVEPGKDRKGVGFSVYKDKEHLYVVPSDVWRDVASGRLDRALFDVAGLIRDKYDDRSAKVIPVIVSYAGKAQKRAVVPGTAVSRQLPVLNGAALKVDKADPAGVIKAAGLQKIWLDGKRRLTLDQSVPQIGAPVAWQAGYTGKGVSVAVLDSGIDTSHPDLATQVAGAKNFTGEADGDQVGHGTHVASTIAGTAAASDGKYKGVAPDAKLYDGKVCGEAGDCQFSAILAGMEWAATEIKAKVVNLSLGGVDTAGTDPLEAAVDRLTAETGTLFVIAAGNDGPTAGTINSPGSAAAALTVGAVDKQDKLAETSSRGPRDADEGLKPDVTAPGVGIVAAKAKDSVIGTPVGDRYLSLDGTSMATPHVAGAAALLAQEHPDWQAAELKGALMGSAKSMAGQTVLEQGAGRVDVGKAVGQSVFAVPGSLSFGIAQFPHTDDVPIVKTVTYRNSGDQPVTLEVAATLEGPDGTAAPAGSIGVSARTVTVPARGSAGVQVTVRTDHDGPDGRYTGRVTATAGSLSVATSVAVTKERESYNLTVRSTGPDGKPTAPVGFVNGLDDGSSRFIGDGEEQQVTLRVLKGTYHLEAAEARPDPSDPDKYRFYTVIQPALQLTKDTTTDLDLRVAKPVELTVPTAGATQAFGLVGYQRASANGQVVFGTAMVTFSNEKAYSGQIGPALPPEQLSGQVATDWGEQLPDGSFRNSPYWYATLNEVPGKYPTGFTRTVKAGELATVRTQLNAVSDRQFFWWLSGVGPHTASGISFGFRYDQPASVTAYVEAAPVKWYSKVDDRTDDFELISGVARPPEAFQAGRTYRQRFFGAAFTPAPYYAARTKGELAIYVSALMDADGNKGFTRVDTAAGKLLRDGKVILEADGWGDLTATNLPPEKATYTVEMSMTRPSFSAFSTRTDLRWTFTSAANAQETLLPMVGLRYQPKVDRNNVARRTPVSVLPFGLVAQPGAAVPSIRKVELEVSGDDGKTWHPATVAPCGASNYQATFATPENAKSISLRAHVTDAQGNVTDQTTIAAYPLS